MTVTIPRIIRNFDDTYAGDLRYYFKVLMDHARNLESPYHNFRHMFHMLWLCYDACGYYDELLLREKRDLLIAALSHDFDHMGRTGNDDLNIELAVRGLKKHILPEDELSFPIIVDLIKATQFPHICSSDKLSLRAQILRDADMSQSLSVAWIQQVIFGLGDEMGVGWRKVLGMQEGFLSNLKFATEWAQKKFSQDVIQEKIEEARELIALL